MNSSIHSETHTLDSTLILFDLTHSSTLILHALTLELTTLGGEPIEARLQVKVDAALYARISADALFGLHMNARHPKGTELPPDVSVLLDLILSSGMLVRLSGCRSAADAADLLLRWNRIQPDDALFATNNWLAIRIHSDDGANSYTTVWAEFAPSRLARDLADGRIGAIIDLLGTFGTARDAMPTSPIAELPALIDQLVIYLKSEHWPYLPLEGQSALQLAYQGTHATWTCFARVREEQRQLTFYSICPIRVPANRRATLAEFITRANYGLIIGNFELYLNDGELRYKTSIDATEAPLTSGALRRVIAANVQTMDRYLPGIFMVISDQLPPVDAIAHVEGSQ